MRISPGSVGSHSGFFAGPQAIDSWIGDVTARGLTPVRRCLGQLRKGLPVLNPRALLTKRRLLAAGVTVVILGAGGVAWAMNRTSGSAAKSTTTLVAANTQPLRQVVSATGTIKPASEADLSFSVSGTVTSVPAIVGGTVA